MTKQVQLSNEAYRRLRHAKQGGESFSDVVLRVLDEEKDPWAFVGSSRSGPSLKDRLAAADEMKGPRT